MRRNRAKSEKQQRFTNQKMAALSYLKSVKSHPPVEVVYQEVKKALPRISMATVYRNLKDLSKQGLIQEIPDKTIRYDGDVSPHAHFICEKCQMILDICPIFEGKNSKCGHSHGAVRIFTAGCPFLNPQKIKVGKINKYQINIYGLCKKCR